MIDPNTAPFLPPWLDRLRPHIQDHARHLYKQKLSKRMERLLLKYIHQSTPTPMWFPYAGWLDVTGTWRWRGNIARAK